MSDATEPLRPEHVIDRHGFVWRVVRDGGMATRADYIGITSIGIEELRATRGPLIELEEALVRSTPAEALDPNRPMPFLQRISPPFTSRQQELAQAFREAVAQAHYQATDHPVFPHPLVEDDDYNCPNEWCQRMWAMVREAEDHARIPSRSTPAEPLDSRTEGDIAAYAKWRRDPNRISADDVAWRGTPEYEKVRSTPAEALPSGLLNEEAKAALTDALEWFGGLASRQGRNENDAEALMDALAQRGFIVTLRSTPAEPLDVERLAVALDVLSDHGMEYALMAPEEREDRYDSAQRLAAEYARLSGNEEPTDV